MARIFPFLDIPASKSVKKELPVFREYAWDFEAGRMELVNGVPVTVEGDAALKVWIYKALTTPRYRHLGYSRSYGSELEALTGSTFSPRASQIEVERYVREALMVSPYIRSVPLVKVLLEKDKLAGSVTVETVYGEVMVDV